MKLLVKLLRKGGAIRPREEVDAAPWVIVSIVTDTHSVRGRRLVLREHGYGGMPGAEGVVRELYGATLREVSEACMVLRGIERSIGPTGQAAAVVQEWMIKPAPELGPGGWSSPAAGQFSRDARALAEGR